MGFVVSNTFFKKPATTTLAWAVAEATRKCLISDATCKLILQREAARTRGNTVAEQKPDKFMKKSKREDKKAWRLQKLYALGDPWINWKYVKNEKVKFDSR